METRASDLLLFSGKRNRHKCTLVVKRASPKFGGKIVIFEIMQSNWWSLMMWTFQLKINALVFNNLCHSSNVVLVRQCSKFVIIIIGYCDVNWPACVVEFCYIVLMSSGLCHSWKLREKEKKNLLFPYLMKYKIIYK